MTSFIEGVRCFVDITYSATGVAGPTQEGKWLIGTKHRGVKIRWSDSRVKCPYCERRLQRAVPSPEGRVARVLGEPMNGKQEVIYDPLPKTHIALHCSEHGQFSMTRARLKVI